MNETKILTAQPIELEGEIIKRRLTNRRRGNDTGWKQADKFMSLKRGYPMMIGGVGGAGKTELAFDIAINSAIMYGWSFFVFSPETGDKYEIMEYLIDKLANGKSLEQPSERPISDTDLAKMTIWLNKHFRIMDVSEHWDDNYNQLPLTMDNLFAAVDVEERRLGAKFDGVIVDTFNDLDIEPKSVEVKKELMRALHWIKKKNYLGIITNHANDKNEIREKVSRDPDEWVTWTPPNKKEEWAYGQQFAKKGYQMLLVYEQPHHLVRRDADDGDFRARHSIENNYNSRIIYVQKSKPKGVGRTGMFRLFYDRQRNRYYEVDSLGARQDIKYPEL